MNNTFKSFLLCATYLAFFALPVHSKTITNEATVAGNWYSEFKGDGFLRLSIAERNPDTSFKITFYKCDQNGLTWLQSEYGYWSHTNGFYNTKIVMTESPKSNGPNSVLYFEKYEILKLTNNFFKYRNTNSNKTYTNTRVDKSYDLLCQELIS